MRSLLAPSLLAAACGGAATAPAVVDNQPPVDETRACPPAEAVRLAYWDVRFDASGAEVGRWVLPLGVWIDDGAWEDPPRPPAADLAPGPRTAEQARRLASGPIEGDVWLLVAGAAPCRTRIAGYELETPEPEGLPYHRLIAHVEDACPAPPDGHPTSWAALTPELGACRLMPAEPAGARLGGVELDAAGVERLVVDAGPPAPPEVVAALPSPPCSGPGCELLWSVRRAGAPTLSAHEVLATWMRPDPTQSSCEWAAHTHHAIYLGPERGPLSPVTIEGRGWDVAAEREGNVPIEMALAGVLADDGGPRVLLSHRVGHFGAHDIDGTALGAGRVEQWYVHHEEDGDWFSHAPYCGP